MSLARTTQNANVWLVNYEIIKRYLWEGKHSQFLFFNGKVRIVFGICKRWLAHPDVFFRCLWILCDIPTAVAENYWKEYFRHIKFHRVESQLVTYCHLCLSVHTHIWKSLALFMKKKKIVDTICLLSRSWSTAKKWQNEHVQH